MYGGKKTPHELDDTVRLGMIIWRLIGAASLNL